MTFTKSVAGIIPGMMAISLVGHTVKTIPTNWGPKGVKKVNTKEMIKGFTGIMIGVPMIRATSGMVSAL